MNGRKDAIISKRLYNEEKVRTTIKNWNGEKHFTDDYSAPATLKWLQSMEADIFVVHSSSWLDKKVQKGRHWYILKVEIDAPNTQYPAHSSVARGGLAWAGPLRYEVVPGDR